MEFAWCFTSFLASYSHLHPNDVLLVIQNWDVKSFFNIGIREIQLNCVVNVVHIPMQTVFGQHTLDVSPW